MDLNEVPNDLMVNGLKNEEKKMVNLDDVVDKNLGCCRIKSNEVEKRFRDLEEKGLVLDLEIKNRVMKLEDIEAKIRVLGDEKLKVEEEIRELKKRKKEVEEVDVEVEDDVGGGEVREKKGSGRGDSPHILTPVNKRKRDVMVVTSDESDDECEVIGCQPNRRAFKLVNSDNEGDENEVLKIGSESESDDTDDDKPISELMSRRAHRCSSQTAGTLNRTRPRRRLVKYGQRDKPQEVEKENGANDDLSEEGSGASDRSLSNFIVDDESDEENAKNDALKDDIEDHSVELEGESDCSDDDLDFEDIISRLQSRRDPNSKWTSEGDMLADFGKNPELCLRAVCAVYRQQTNEEKACKASLIPNGRGFSKFDATRGTRLGEFLTDGDPNGDLVKTVEELKEFDHYGLEECRTLANHYSKQLFNIYENEEDPFFP